MIAGATRVGMGRPFKRNGLGALKGFTYSEAEKILDFDTGSSGQQVTEVWTAPAGTKITKVEGISGQTAPWANRGNTAHLSAAMVGPGGVVGTGTNLVVSWTDTTVVCWWGWSGKLKITIEAPADTTVYPDYSGVESSIKALIARIAACTAGDTTVPAHWSLEAPPATAPDDVKRAHTSYRLALDTELPNAREDARVLCSTPGTGNGGASDGSDPSPAPDQPSGGNGSFIIRGNQGDAYGTSYEDIYAPQARDGNLAIVANPFAPSPAAEPVPRSNVGRKVAVGGVILVGGLLLVAWRKKARR